MCNLGCDTPLLPLQPFSIFRVGIFGILVSGDYQFVNLPTMGLTDAQPISGKSTYLAPRIYGSISANTWDPEQLHIPPGAWVEWKQRGVSKSLDSLHIDEEVAFHHRKVYGYIGHIRKIARSGSTDSPYLTKNYG